MSPSDAVSRSSSRDLEQEALRRFRLLAPVIPPECIVYRETWNNNTAVCLDFQHCPLQLERVKENSPILMTALETLGLGKSIIFREGNHIRGWRNLLNSSP